MTQSFSGFPLLKLVLLTVAAGHREKPKKVTESRLCASSRQEAEYIVTKIKQQQYNELLGKDQLNMARNEGKVFLHFGETQQRARFLARERSLHWMWGEKKYKNDNCAIADEEEITFPPTYRFERDTRDKYAYTKAKATGVGAHRRSLQHAHPHPGHPGLRLLLLLLGRSFFISCIRLVESRSEALGKQKQGLDRDHRVKPPVCHV